jgi:O-glycosyl hydrolase
MRTSLLAVIVCSAVLSGSKVVAATPVRIVVHAEKPRQEFQGLGCGVIYFERHVTSLAARGKNARQSELYDDMFAKVNTRYLQLMIRSQHEPQGFNRDPWSPRVDPANFKGYESTLAIAKAAKQRRPDIELLATLYSPPAWMKTNNSESGGGNQKGTLKPGMELAYVEYLWTFLAHMARNGCPIKYLAIVNECDWPHTTQPACYFTPEVYARLFKTAGEYLEKMAVKYPDVPRPLLVGPNNLGAPNAVHNFVPAMEKAAGKYLAVLAAHDYDTRGDRWGDMQRIAHGRPVWMTEWCARDPDASPGKIKSAVWYASMMHDAFAGGVNVWMAYDWVYPPQKGGESLIRVDWGRDYTLEKPYWVFRQWAAPLVPGMHVVASESSAAGIKATALASAKQGLVVHVVNTTDSAAEVQLGITGFRTSKVSANRQRTSAAENSATLPPLPPRGKGYADSLPPRSLTTYQFLLK